jgi:hypothetical protein
MMPRPARAGWVLADPGPDDRIDALAVTAMEVITPDGTVILYNS